MEWYYSMDSTVCSTVDRLDLEDDYNREHEHRWAGLDDSIESVFSAVISGYLNIGKEAPYNFTLTAKDNAALYFDSMTTPLILIEGESAYARTLTESIVLSSGRHLIRLIYANNGGSARLKLRYASPIAGLPDTVIDDTVTFLGGQAPSFLHASSISTVRNGVIKLPRIRVTGSRVTDYSISPALPAGIHLNHVTGAISGTSAMEVNGDYIITATNTLGSVETPIHVMVSGTPIRGLSAEYYRLETHQECQLERFAEDDISLQVHTVDSSVNHPLAKRGSVWPGVPDDVFPRFFVRWSGFVFASVPGDYSLQLRSRDGGRVFVAQKLLVSSWGCLKEVKTATGTITLEHAGFVPVEVEYFASDNDFGAILLWKQPLASEFEPISASCLWHIPSASFSYASPQMHYYRNVPIPENDPIFFRSSFQPSRFSIDPPLPAGLILTENGQISGTPSTDAPRTTHTVTAFSASGTTCQATVSIAVSFVAPPSELHVLDSEGREVSVVEVNQFSPIPSLALTALNARAWTVEPDLPTGVSLGVDPIGISGVPIVALAPTVFTIMARNSGGFVSKTVSISVSGCDQGKWFYSSVDGKESVSFVLRRPNGEIVYENEVVGRGDYGMTLCVPSGSYNYTMRCSDETAARCYLSLVREDRIVFFSHYTTYNNSYSGSFATQITEKPTLWVESPPLLLNAKQSFTLHFNTTGRIQPLFAVPAFPDTLRIDEGFNRIVGSFSSRGTYSFRLVARNDAGEASSEITFHVETCPEGEGFITFSRGYGNDDESVVVSNAAGVEVLNARFNNDRFVRRMCLQPGEYTVVMRTGRQGGNWEVASELVVKDAWDDLLASTLLDNGKGEKTEHFSINYPIADRSTMKFYNREKAPASQWNQLDFDDKDWALGDYGSFGEFEASTAYFRREFEVDDRNKYNVLAFELEILEGVVVYLNGQEVSRRNMNGGAVTHETAAVSRYHALMWRRETVVATRLRTGRNVLAVELHRMEGEKLPIRFDVYGTLLMGECIKQTDKARALDSEHTPSERFAPSNAFDGSLRTLWRDGNLPVFLQLSYDYDRREVVNKVVITAGSDHRSGLPKKFDVLGMVDEDHGEVLASVDNRHLFTQGYDSAVVYLENTRAFGAYRVRVEEANDGGDFVGMAELGLFSCHLTYCPKQKGWAAVRAGETVFGSCPRGRFGEASRSCEMEVAEAAWSEVDYATCLDTVPPERVAFVDFKYMVSNCTMYDFGRFVEPRFIGILSELLLVKKEGVKLFSVRDCSDSETINVCFFVRVTAELSGSKAVFARMKAVQEEMSYRMYTNPPLQMPEGMYFIVVTTPLLRVPASKVGVVVVVLLLLLIVVGTGAAVLRIRKGRKVEKVRLL